MPAPQTSPASPHPTPPAGRIPRWIAVAALLLGFSIVAACSDKTESASPGRGASGRIEPADVPPLPLEGPEVEAEACEAFAALGQAMSGDPSAAAGALDSLEASLPSSLSHHGGIVVKGYRAAVGGDQKAMADPEFITANEALGSAMWAGCRVTSRMDVTGVDYGFESLPETVPSGRSAIRFTNQTSNSEPHEMIILERPAEDETPLEEIASKSPEELMGAFPMVGVVFADQQGSAATSLIDLPAGRYIAVCTIPVSAGDDAGDSHASHGMVGEFQAT